MAPRLNLSLKHGGSGRERSSGVCTAWRLQRQPPLSNSLLEGFGAMGQTFSLISHCAAQHCLFTDHAGTNSMISVFVSEVMFFSVAASSAATEWLQSPGLTQDHCNKCSLPGRSGD